MIKYNCNKYNVSIQFQSKIEKKGEFSISRVIIDNGSEFVFNNFEDIDVLFTEVFTV